MFSQDLDTDFKIRFTRISAKMVDGVKKRACRSFKDCSSSSPAVSTWNFRIRGCPQLGTCWPVMGTNVCGKRGFPFELHPKSRVQIEQASLLGERVDL